MAKSDVTYYESATAKCTNCNSVYTLGMTVEYLEVEICGNCHPFYTGQETLIDTAGRIEKFKARLAKSESSTKKKDRKKKTKQRKAVQSLADLNLGGEEKQMSKAKKPDTPKKEEEAKPKAEKVEEAPKEAATEKPAQEKTQPEKKDSKTSEETKEEK